MRKFYEVAQKMSKYLCKTEERVSVKELQDKLIEAASLDPQNMKVGAVQIPGESVKRPVVVGEHALKRGGTRLGVDAGKVLSMATDALSNPFIGAEAVSHPVFWDDVSDQVAPFEDDRIASTIVVDQSSRYTLIFEAGFGFILLKTVWDNCFGELRTSTTNMVVNVDKNGAVTRKVGGRA